jgi:hypothetical protein
LREQFPYQPSHSQLLSFLLQNGFVIPRGALTEIELKLMEIDMYSHGSETRDTARVSFLGEHLRNLNGCSFIESVEKKIPFVESEWLFLVSRVSDAIIGPPSMKVCLCFLSSLSLSC